MGWFIGVAQLCVWRAEIGMCSRMLRLLRAQGRRAEDGLLPAMCGVPIHRPEAWGVRGEAKDREDHKVGRPCGSSRMGRYAIMERQASNECGKFAAFGIL